MSIKNTFFLFLLAAIWGGSFIFMRVLAPVYGAIGTANIRLAVGALFLLMVFKITGHKINWRRDWKMLAIIGVINSAIPFSCYAYAALHIPASVSVVINSMTPMFGAVFASLFLKEHLTVNKGLGLLFGTVGVAIISGSKSLPNTTEAYLAVAACLVATFCYGLSSVMVKKYAGQIPSRSMAAGSQFFAAIALIPFLLNGPSILEVSIQHLLLAIVFGVLCSAVAYLIYYYLIVDAGPTSALSVTFLMPVFGIFWGQVLLGEQIYAQMLVGAFVILMGTYLVVKPRRLTKEPI